MIFVFVMSADQNRKWTLGAAGVSSCVGFMSPAAVGQVSGSEVRFMISQAKKLWLRGEKYVIKVRADVKLIVRWVLTFVLKRNHHRKSFLLC